MGLRTLYLSLFNSVWLAVGCVMIAAAAWLIDKENSAFSAGFMAIACYYLFAALIGHLTKECGFGRLFWMGVLILMGLFQLASLIALAGWPNQTIKIIREGGKKADAASPDPNLRYHSRAADFLHDEKTAALFLLGFGLAGIIIAVSFISCLRPVMIVRDEKPPLYL